MEWNPSEYVCLGGTIDKSSNGTRIVSHTLIVQTPSRLVGFSRVYSWNLCGISKLLSFSFLVEASPVVTSWLSNWDISWTIGVGIVSWISAEEVATENGARSTLSTSSEETLEGEDTGDQEGNFGNEYCFADQKYQLTEENWSHSQQFYSDSSEDGMNMFLGFFACKGENL